jgi:hypothetical protein
MMLVLLPSFSKEINLPQAPDVVILYKSSWSYLFLKHLRSTMNHVVVPFVKLQGWADEVCITNRQSVAHGAGMSQYINLVDALHADSGMP